MSLANVQSAGDDHHLRPDRLRHAADDHPDGGQLELSDTAGDRRSPARRAGVTISGGGPSRVFQVDGGVTASISGLTITGGQYDRQRRRPVDNSGTLTLTNCTISGNSANGLGGGLFNYPGSTTITGCTFSGDWRPRAVG